MPCYVPLDAWLAKEPNESGKYSMVFSREGANLTEPRSIACGKCIGCRLDRSRQWAVRCTHEAQLHDEKTFITLTYNDENLPSGASLDKKHWQDFMKRLRHHLHPKKIRFFMCGEYGDNHELHNLDTIGRPHFHAIIFGHEFQDGELHDVINENKLYTSKTLDKIWGKGFASFGAVTFESAAYVARYIMKKIDGELADEHYRRVDLQTGEITYLHPEFTLCSTRPGIARDWFLKFKNDLNKDFITVNGIKMRPPKYYDKLFESLDDDNFCFIKTKRSQSIDTSDPEFTRERLDVKHDIKKRKLKLLKRTAL